MKLETLLTRFRKDRPAIHPTLTPEQRAQSESVCEGVLQKEDFGRPDFYTFNENLLPLVAMRVDGRLLQLALLDDQEAEVKVILYRHSIRVDGYSQYTKISDAISPTLYQNLSYKAESVPTTFFGKPKPEDFQPVLTTIIYNVVDWGPPAIPHPPYFKIGTGPNPKADDSYPDQLISNKDAQAILAQVYSLYARNKTPVVPQES